MKRGSDRCESWCRHYFRTGGEALCAFGSQHVRTENGAPCLGRKERTSGGNKSEFARLIGPPKKRWTPPPEDPYCRPECEYFSDGACHFGLEPCATENGARCIGTKRIPRKKRFR